MGYCDVKCIYNKDSGELIQCTEREKWDKEQPVTKQHEIQLQDSF